MKIRVALMLLTLIICPVIACQEITSGGSIEGTVVSKSGQPIVGAKVNADANDGKIRATPIRYAITDHNGRFKLDKLQWFEYKVFAMKEEDGFPNTKFAFYSNNVFTKVRLTPQAPTAILKLVVSKAAKISGSIINNSTKTGITATFELRRFERPEFSIMTAFTASYVILVPADAEIGLKVTAKGYKDWNYPGIEDASKSRPLKVSTGKKKVIDIELSPEP